jgi:receptor protein-tyrosine kinase
LQTLADLQTSNATVVQLATRGGQISPRTKRNAGIALILGILLGAALAFLREALDTRVRTAHEVGERLGLPLLGRVPEPPKRLRAANQLVMLDEPSSVAAEAFRVLRTNLEFATLDHDVRTVMITSAVEQEGKSTTIANLAIALARGGQRVILVDLDLRRPYLGKFFDLEDRPGVTQLVLGRAAFGDALTRIPLSGSGRAATENGRTVTRGQLAVLGSGPIPPDPGEFVSSAALSSVLAQLRKVADIVLIDAPPLLSVGDALVLSAKVDAVILATRMEKVRRPMLGELKRLIDSAPTRPLGFVVTGAEAESGYGEGYGYGYGYYGYGYTSRPTTEAVTEDVAT